MTKVTNAAGNVKKAREITAALLEKLDAEHLYGWDDEIERIEDNEKWQYLARYRAAISWIVFEELAGREPTDAERKALAEK